jgi:hypothetical protein
VAAIVTIALLARGGTGHGDTDELARIEKVEWSLHDQDRDGLTDWLQLDLALRLPEGVQCTGGASLEQTGRHLAHATTVLEMTSLGMLQAVQIPMCVADSLGRCTLSLAFDGASIRSRARDGRCTAHVEVLWRASYGDPHSYYGHLRRDIASPSLRIASFRSAPFVTDEQLPEADRILDSIRTARAMEASKASITNARWSAVDENQDGLNEQLQIDLVLIVPPGVECRADESWLEQEVRGHGTRLVAGSQEVDGARSGSPPSGGGRWVVADSSGHCALRIAFDGDSLRTHAVDGGWTADLVVNWRRPGSSTSYSVERRLEIPGQRAASYGRAPDRSRPAK